LPRTITLGQHSITAPERVTALFDAVARAGACLPAFCTENEWTTHAIVEAVDEVATELGASVLPICVSATGHHSMRTQLLNYAPGVGQRPRDAAIEGMDHMLFDLDRALEGTRNTVLAVPHLDHGDPADDGDLIEYVLEHRLMGTLMYDCSHHPDAENLRMTKAFVERTRGTVLVEGICEQILEPGQKRDAGKATDTEVVVRYVNEARPFLVVANLGTEHRVTRDDYKPEYRGDVAQALTAALGRRMLCLHGTSSLTDQGLGRLPDDGVIKINIWTRVEREGARALSQYVQDHHSGYATQQDLDVFPLCNVRRAWMARVKAVYRDYMVQLNYANLLDVQGDLRAVMG